MSFHTIRQIRPASFYFLALYCTLWLSGCSVFSAYQYPQRGMPVSRYSYRSMLTDLPLSPEVFYANLGLDPFDGYPDNQVFAPRAMADTTKCWPCALVLHPFLGMATADDTSGRKLYWPGHLPPGLDKIYFKSIVYKQFETPGSLWVLGTGLSIDEIEVPNIEWQSFINYVDEDSGRTAADRYFPDTTRLPIATYFTDPFYRYYPVVGVSRAQVNAYCRWRSAVTTEGMRTVRGLSLTHPDYMVMRYRLPTEAEWEYAAGITIRPNEPYGVPEPDNKVRINPKAAGYLRHRSQTEKSVADIKRDIIVFNSTLPEITQFNCQRQAPYFLALPTPGYVYDLPQNFFGLYHMAGNVAELMQEPGLTKGGSYRDPLAACTTKARGRYEGPSPSIGFRCVCEISFPNRH